MQPCITSVENVHSNCYLQVLVEKVVLVKLKIELQARYAYERLIT